MSSPTKKVELSTSEETWSGEKARPLVGLPDLHKKPESDDKVAVADGIKSEEADEPLLRENPSRFVLFPIQYHEVSFRRRVESDASMLPMTSP